MRGLGGQFVGSGGWLLYACQRFCERRKSFLDVSQWGCRGSGRLLGRGLALVEQLLDDGVGEEVLDEWVYFGLPFRGFERDDDIQESFERFFNRGNVRHGGGMGSRRVPLWYLLYSDVISTLRTGILWL